MRRIIVLLLCGAGWIIPPFEAAAQSSVRYKTGSAATWDWGPSSLRLSEGMTERETISVIGYLPSKAELSTCGGDTKSGEWDCRILTFGTDANGLIVYEARSDGGWLVNNWTVYP
jgi:hypothetical protein